MMLGFCFGKLLPWKVLNFFTGALFQNNSSNKKKMSVLAPMERRSKLLATDTVCISAFFEVILYSVHFYGRRKLCYGGLPNFLNNLSLRRMNARVIDTLCITVYKDLNKSK